MYRLLWYMHGRMRKHVFDWVYQWVFRRVFGLHRKLPVQRGVRNSSIRRNKG